MVYDPESASRAHNILSEADEAEEATESEEETTEAEEAEEEVPELEPVDDEFSSSEEVGEPLADDYNDMECEGGGCDLDSDAVDAGFEPESLLGRMGDLAAEAADLSVELGDIADDLGGSSEMGIEDEEVDVAMIDEIQSRIDSVAASMARRRESKL